MLFVSQKEPLPSETLPDTSLHNDRSQVQVKQATDSSCSSSFFHLPNACVSKLTKEQLDLHREFLRLGSLLMADNVDLFHNALTLMSTKYNLKVLTPATSVSDVINPSYYIRHNRKAGCTDESTAVPKQSNRKYVLPKDVEDKEFYQCMICKEKRAANSFGKHTHEGVARPDIRWYCPLCDTFFAVTHRGYHVKSRHPDVLTIARPASSEEVQKKSGSVSDSPVALKRGRETGSVVEDESGLVSFSPAEKVQHSECESPSTASVQSFGSSWFDEEDESCSLFPVYDDQELFPFSNDDASPFSD